MEKKKFLDLVVPFAIETMKKTKISGALITAQAILESGWGEHAPSYNLFGIKGTGPAGTQKLLTTEYINGRPVKVYANFRAYHNYGESLEDHTNLFLKLERYKNLIGADFENSCKLVKLDGYATDIHYTELLLKIGRDNKLEELIDKQVKQPSIQKTFHVVVKGDTVSKLATKYKSSVKEIKEWNKLANVNLIQIGQKLRVK